MNTAELAVVECTAGTLADALGTAALDGPSSEPHDEMFARVTSEALTTPASAAEPSQASFCTIDAEVFDRIVATGPAEALFPVRSMLNWLEWFDDERITLSFVGESGATVASHLRLTGTDREVVVDCVSDPAVLEEIQLWLPDRFDGAQFLDAGGDPVPTRVETTTAELRQLTTAVAHCDGIDRYPLTATDGRLQFELDDETTTVSGQLDGAVEGPGFDHRYDSGFRRVVSTLEGAVTLQTSPEGPLAIVEERPGATFRYVLEPLGDS